MKKLLLMIPCIVMTLLLICPTTSLANTFNDFEYAKSTTCSLNVKGQIVNISVLSSNPDADIYLIHHNFMAGSMSIPTISCAVVGADTDILILKNGDEYNRYSVSCIDESELLSFPFFVTASEGVNIDYGVPVIYRDINASSESEDIAYVTNLSTNVMTSGEISCDSSKIYTLLDNAGAFDVSEPPQDDSGSSGSGGTADVSLVEMALNLIRDVMALFMEYPLNIIIIFTLAGFAFGLFRRARKAVR